MERVVISGSGLYTPPYGITNDELVSSYNAYVELHNNENSGLIAEGHLEALSPSSADFIEKASGIKHRYVMQKEGILDPKVMTPQIPALSDDELSIQAKMGCEAAIEALKSAQLDASEIDLIIVAAAYLQRAYPAIAIEIQQALGCRGYGYDMQVACSSATFGIEAARSAVQSGMAKRVLVINPELCSPQVNYCDRDSHFIFGDVATALVVEAQRECRAQRAFLIRSSRCFTQFSSNIRSNFGHINRCDPGSAHSADKLFYQHGRKVFKELLPLICSHLLKHISDENLSPGCFRRLWLHQANLNMNQFVVKKLMGETVSYNTAPVVLDEFANTASAGSIIAFHKNRDDIQQKDLGLLCSFGAGYSIGSLVLEAC